jgi:hypothetical protein
MDIKILSIIILKKIMCNGKMGYGGTSYNRTVTAPTAGYAKHQSAQAPLWCFTPPHFCGCWNTSCSFIATAKTSVTAGTLYEMPPKIG